MNIIFELLSVGLLLIMFATIVIILPAMIVSNHTNDDIDHNKNYNKNITKTDI